jgi:hypothetical protein
MAPIFGRSKSVRTTAAELADAVNTNTSSLNHPSAAPPMIRKSKSFKRIRGLLRVGESRRERRARKEAERSLTASSMVGGRPPPRDTTQDDDDAAGSVMTHDLQDMDDQSTIMNYNVDVDDRSVATQSTVATNLFPATNDGTNATTAAAGSSEQQKLGGEYPPSYTLKVVLLLMDPETRRFELLQLEFDALKALVSDVLAQIPISVTEEALRQQSYTGIAGTDGIEMEPFKLLAAFSKGNEVLVAIPQGVPAKECTRLARPILSDDNVVAMVCSVACGSCWLVLGVTFVACLCWNHMFLMVTLHCIIFIVFVVVVINVSWYT